MKWKKKASLAGEDVEKEDGDGPNGVEAPLQLSSMDELKFDIVLSLVNMVKRGDCDKLFAYQCMQGLIDKTNENYHGIEASLERPNMTAQVFMAHVESSMLDDDAVEGDAPTASKTEWS
ncbi:hypothetical protein MPSEU_000022300 [Mayamaea pseudoterrestris]|nr:hypothetical protein MPSEU_000022300 [Mayamaea pseudoterrestris]